jgi:hypothetical protein
MLLGLLKQLERGWRGVVDGFCIIDVKLILLDFLLSVLFESVGVPCGNDPETGPFFFDGVGHMTLSGSVIMNCDIPSQNLPGGYGRVKVKLSLCFFLNENSMKPYWGAKI